MDEKKIFSLLRQSNELKKNKNSLDPEASGMLLDSLETIFISQKGENILTWRKIFWLIK